MASQRKTSQPTERTGKYDLADILRGNLPEASTVALIGEPGAGTTVFSLHYVANALSSGRKVVFVSFDYPPTVLVKYLDSFNFDVRPHISSDRLAMIDGYEILCKMMGISRTYEIENLRPIPSQELIAEFDRVAFSRYSPKEGEHFSYVADSFTAMAPFLDVRSAYNTVAEICERMRNGGHTALLLGHEGVLESNFVQAMTRFVDGVIRLRMKWQRKGFTREIFAEKLPLVTIKHPFAEFETSTRGIELKYDNSREIIGVPFSSVPGIKPKTESAVSSQFRPERVSTGVPELDPMLGGGLPGGAFVCLRGDIGTGTSTLCAQYAWSRLLAGGSINFNCVDEPPDMVARRFKSFGWDVDKYIENKKLNLADAYHFFVETPRILDKGLKGISARRKALDEFMRKQNEIVARTLGPTQVAVVIDSFTAMAPYLDLKSSYVLARMIADSARRMNQPIIAVVRSSVVEANLLYACLGTADGLIELENAWTRRDIVRKMRIKKMIYTSTPTHPIEYAITRKGIELVSSKRE